MRIIDKQEEFLNENEEHLTSIPLMNIIQNDNVFPGLRPLDRLGLGAYSHSIETEGRPMSRIELFCTVACFVVFAALMFGCFFSPLLGLDGHQPLFFIAIVAWVWGAAALSLRNP